MPILETILPFSTKPPKTTRTMKSKYCLVRTDAPLDVGSFVYVVWVGTTDTDFEKLCLVQEFCKDVGWYFKRWSATVDSALEKRRKISRTDGTRAVTPYTMIQLNIRQCYEAILDDSFAAIETNHVMTPQETRWRFRNTIPFILRQNGQSCNTTCPPSRRKYLSHRGGKAFYNVGLNLSLAILLIILDAIISNLFNI